MLQVTMMRSVQLPVTHISTSASDQHCELAADDRKRLKSVEADVVRFLSSRVSAWTLSNLTMLPEVATFICMSQVTSMALLPYKLHARSIERVCAAA